MSIETPTQPLQPIFDPENPGQHLDDLQVRIPIYAPWLNGLFSGDVPSKRHGHGYEKDGVRDLEDGDDVRHIDWNLTARQTDLYPIPQVRIHHRDINPDVWIATDALQSRNHIVNPRDNPGQFPEQLLALSAVTAFMRIAHATELPWGLIASDDKGLIVRDREAQLGRRHTMKAAHTLAAHFAPETDEPQGRTHSFEDLLRFTGKKSVGNIVVVVSDFRQEAITPTNTSFSWENTLREIVKKGSEVIAVETTNPWDFELPETDDRIAVNGTVLYVGSGKKGQANRDRYKDQAARQAAEIEATLARVGVKHITLKTEEGRWLDSLVKQLDNRRRSVSNLEDIVENNTTNG